MMIMPLNSETPSLLPDGLVMTDYPLFLEGEAGEDEEFRRAGYLYDEEGEEGEEE
jgi:hypothetical protein